MKPDVVRGILRSASDNNLWATLLPLVGNMKPEPLAVLAEVATHELPPSALEKILQAAHQFKMWPAMLHLAEDMSDAQLERIGEAAKNLPQAAIEGAMKVADESDLWQAMLPLASRLSDGQKQMVAGLAQFTRPDIRDRIVAAARASVQKLWPALLDVIQHIPREQRREFGNIVRRYAQQEPGLVALLTPAARARGLDDLLQFAQQP